MYKLKIIDSKNKWNDFIINWGFEFYSFVDSWEWWEFQILEGNYIFRLWIYNKKELIWVIQLIKVVAKRWTYFFTPHGPLIQWNYFKVLDDIQEHLVRLAESENCSFIRLNWVQSNTEKNKSKYKNLWFIDAPMHIHAEDTHLLSLEASEDELLSNIAKKDRYYINRAKKEGVVIRIDNKKDHIDTLINYHQTHAVRDNGKHKYTAFSKKYIKNLYKVFSKEDISTISASYEWYIESIMMTIKFWNTCVYYVAASDIRSNKFSPNYLCQWEAILKAKQDGCTLYNFWWVSPDGNPNHPIAWVSKFKRKFAWYDYSLLHAQDLVISSWYWFNWAIETFRRKKRWYYYKKPE